MAKLYGEIDLTAIDKSIIREVKFRDGSIHKFINIAIGELREVDRNNNDHYVKVYVPKNREADKILAERGKLWLGRLRTHQPQAAPQSTPSTSQAVQQDSEDNLPF